MTTPEGPGLTAEAMDLLERLMALNSRSFPLATAKDLAAIEAATLARHVRETGCEGLREALRRLIDAIETTGLHEHDDGRGGVDLCIPISGIRGVMNDACEAAGHEFLHPEDVPPFCRWCGAALAPTVAACAREGCGHEERHHRVDPDDIPWCWKDCPCPGYLAPSPATEAERRGGEG